MPYELIGSPVDEIFLAGVTGKVFDRQDGDGIEGLAAFGEDEKPRDDGQNQYSRYRRIGMDLLEPQEPATEDHRGGSDRLQALSDRLEVLEQLVHALVSVGGVL